MSLTRIFSLLLIVPLTGCGQLGYYAQAAKGQWEIIHSRKPIEQVLQDPGQSEAVKTKLRLIQDMRHYAVTQLNLPDNKSYRSYADLGRKQVVWNVVATQPFSISAKQWCFPVAGCLAYKGFFDEADARALEATLREENLDTYVYGVAAYSTLGWFSDPVLNTFSGIR